jgi:hypothetical protein
MEAAAHHHSLGFQQKRRLFFALMLVMIVCVTLMAFTGSLAAGVVAAVALGGALFTGVNVVCHKGCSPVRSRPPR